MKIGITGGCGFVGGHLSRRFRERGDAVVVVDSLIRRGSEITAASLSRMGVEVVRGDTRLPGDLHALHGCDVILDCSAQPSAVAGFTKPLADFEHNTLGVMNVLELCRREQCALIFWSTNKVYSGSLVNAIPRVELATRFAWSHAGIGEDFPLDGADKSIYGATKAAADLLCQEWGVAFDFPVCVNRCSCLAGPMQWGKSEQGWVAWFCIAAELGLPVELIGWGGKQVRDVLFAPDLCDLIEHQVDARATGVFAIGGGASCTLSPRELVSWLSAERGFDLPHTLVTEARRSDHAIYVSDIRRVRHAFSWRPRVSLAAGLTAIVRWARECHGELAGLYAAG